MNEKSLKKKIIKYTVAIALISAVILGCSTVVVLAVKKADERSYTAYVESLMNEYKLQVDERMTSDFETLTILAELMSEGKISRESIINDEIADLSESSIFLKFGYYDKDMDKEPVPNKGGEEKYLFNNLPKEAREAIQKAWQGEKNISQMYEEDGKQVFTYALPVYKNGEVQGALTGIEELDKFYDIINGGTLVGDEINIFWTDAEGSVIAESGADPLLESPEEIIREARFDDSTTASTKISHCGVQWDGMPYTLYRVRLDRNGWQLIYIDNGKEIRSPVYSMMGIVAGASSILFLTCMVFMIYTYNNNRKDNKKMLSLAEKDQLTQMDNMNKFLEDTDELVAKNPNYCMAVLNFRHFQYINDIFGKEQADELLRETAAVLKRSVTEGERCCRYRADQFYLLLKNHGMEQVRARLQAIMDEISVLPTMFHKKYTAALYCGVAIGSKEWTGEMLRQKLVTYSEFAMKMTRNNHENEIAFYDEKMNEERPEKSAELRRWCDGFGTMEP